MQCYATKLERAPMAFGQKKRKKERTKLRVYMQIWIISHKYAPDRTHAMTDLDSYAG